MNRKQVLAVTSTSVMAAGVAQGAITYTAVDVEIAPGGFPAAYEFDLDGDAESDYLVFYEDNKGDKPVVDARPGVNFPGSTNAYTLSNTNVVGGDRYGAPLTLFGATIDAGYAATYAPQRYAALDEEFNGGVVGDWPGDALTDGYVGLAIIDTNSMTTNFGYVNLIYDATSASDSEHTVTIVGYAYNDVAGEKIFAGATNVVTAPVIHTPPASQSVGQGNPATFTVQVLADPAPTYQWMAGAVGSGVYSNLVNDGHFTGVNTAALTINAATTADALDYVVVASNSFGVVTSAPPATLTIIPGALAGPSPSDARLFLGQDAVFEVEVVSGTALSFQWRKDGGDIAGETNATLALPNLSGSEDGDYDVYMVTALGNVFSTNVATLTTVATNGGDFEADILANDPHNYYRLNETEDPFFGAVTAYDNVGAKNGVMNTPVKNGNAFDQIAGPRPADGFPGFASSNWAVQTIPDDPAGSVVLEPWDLNTNAVTLTAWIKPLSEPGEGDAIVYTRYEAENMVCGMQFHSGLFAPPPYALGYNWNDQFGAWSWNSGLFPPVNEWSFVALVVTPTNATVYLLNNDELSTATNTLTHVVQAWDRPVYIGNDPSNVGGGNIFDGMIDEVTSFSRSLSRAEVVGLYLEARGIAGLPALVTEDPVDVKLFAGRTAHFDAAVKGTEPITYRWKKDGVNLVDGGDISGAGTTSLTVVNVSVSDEGSYTLAVTNAYGNDLSAGATFTIQPFSGEAYETALLTLGGFEAYYPLNETEDPATSPTAYDFVSGFSGVYGVNVQNAYSNIAGPRPLDGFPGFATNNAAGSFHPTNDAQINLPPFNLNTNALTITAWINPATNQAQYTGVVFSRGAGTESGLAYTGVDTNTGLANLGYQWNAAFDTYTWVSGLVPPTNTWSFVALVVDPSAGTNSTATVYVINTNGTSWASNTTTNNLVPQSFGGSTLIGRDALEDAADCFDGRIDEVAIYTGALTPAQIQGLYNAAAGIVTIEITIEKVGSQIQLSWPSGTLEEADTVLGPWSANPNASPYLLSPTEPQKYYRVAQ